MRRTIVLGAVLVLAGCSASGVGTGTGSSGPTGPSSPARSTATGTTTVTKSASPSASRSATPADAAPTLTNFRAVDLTWIGAEGWALGSADCLSGKGTCDAVEHTTDGGSSWSSLPAPACAANCVRGVRFANTKIGYAFGPTAFYLTLDGGHHWRHEPGNAVALEAADDNVLRVTTSAGCPPGCTYHVQASLYGNPTWKTLSLGRTPAGVAVTLGRAGKRVYLETFLNAAGGAQRATASLYTSGDDGAHWTYRGEPCPQGRGSIGGGEVDSAKLSVAPTGSAAIDCVPRGETDGELITTVDGGSSWRTPSRNGLGSSGGYALGAVTGRRAVASGADASYLTTDGGVTFGRVGAPGQLAWIGFGSTSVGHAIAAGGRSVWRTTDGGATWRRYTFH